MVYSPIGCSRAMRGAASAAFDLVDLRLQPAGLGVRQRPARGGSGTRVRTSADGEHQREQGEHAQPHQHHRVPSSQ